MRQSIRNLNPNALKGLLCLLFSAFTMSMNGQTTPPPTGELIQNFCSQTTWTNAGFALPGDDLSDLEVNGQNLIWYSDVALTQVIAVPSSEILVAGTTYYVTQTIGGVESAALAVTASEQTCSCIKEPDFEEQDDTPVSDGYIFYEQDLSLHKTCGMQLTSTTPTVPIGATNGMGENAAFVTSGTDPNLLTNGVTLSRTNPANPNSTVGMILSGTGLYAVNAAEEITMTKEFIAGEVFVFNYSLILQNPPSHDYEDQPFFQVRLYDQNGSLLQTRCIVSTPDDCVFITANPGGGVPLYYTDWSCFKFNTSGIIGEAARIEFTIADCTAQGHYGYVYLDDFYVGDNLGSGCNDTNFGYLAVNEIHPAGGNTCYVTQPPVVSGACGSGVSATLPFPIEICGVYDAPSSSGPPASLQNLTLNIIQNNNVVGTVTNPSFSGNNFCFTIDETDINVPPYGDFDLQASIDYTLNCGSPYTILIDDRNNMQVCPPAGCPLPLTVCDATGTGIGVFDLTQSEPTITGAWQNGVSFSYYEDPNDAFDQLNEITTPQSYSNTVTGGQIIYVRTEWDIPGTTDDCFYLVELEVQVNAVPIVDLGVSNIVVCGNDSVSVPLGATPSNLADLQTITYEWFLDGVRLAVLGSTYTATATGTYTVTVSNNLNCSVTKTVVIERVDYTVDLGPDLNLCGESDHTLSANVTDNGSTNPIDMSQLQYLWSTGETTKTITITDSGTYTVEVSYRGCTETDQIAIEIAERPEVSLGPDQLKCASEVLTINATIANLDPATLEYAWYRDGGIMNGETASSITITEEATYKVIVNEPGAPSCAGEDIVEVTYYENENCMITEGISPDTTPGKNDNLDLTFLNDRTGISSIEIFNRHGRSVYNKTGGYTNEWAGQSDDGNELVTGTYYYVIKLDAVDKVFDKQVVTGWIYINREIN